MKKEIAVVASIVALAVVAYFTVGLPQSQGTAMSPQSIILGTEAIELEHPIRISAFNVRCICNEKDPLDNWSQGRSKRAATFLADRKIDVVGMQEFEATHGRDLFGTSRRSGLLGATWNFYESPYFLARNAIAWRSDKFDRLAAGFSILQFGLPSSLGDSSFSPRGLSWVQLYERETRKRFYIFNTHLDYRGGTDVNGGSYEQTRADQINQVMRTIREVNTAGLPMVLMGDFNSTPQARAYALVVQSGLFVDAAKTAQLHVNQGINSYHGYALPTKGEPIDFIFTSPGSLVSKYQFVTDTYEGRYPSDHFPLVIDTELK